MGLGGVKWRRDKEEEKKKKKRFVSLRRDKEADQKICPWVSVKQHSYRCQKQVPPGSM